VGAYFFYKRHLENIAWKRESNLGGAGNDDVFAVKKDGIANPMGSSKGVSDDL